MITFLKEKTGIWKALSSDQKFKSFIKLALTWDVKWWEWIKEAGWWKWGLKGGFLIWIWLSTIYSVWNDFGNYKKMWEDIWEGVLWNAFTTMTGIYYGAKAGVNYYEEYETVPGN